MRICSFLWVYHGYPAPTHEGVNVECMRNHYGELFASCDDVEVDSIAGVPDSGIAHAVGYSNVSGVPSVRPFIKHTPTWPKSFMSVGQTQRSMIAKMKLIPVQELIRDKCLLLIDDSIVRGTQLGEATRFLYENDTKEIYVRLACPPIIFGCKYLSLSHSESEMGLITRRVIHGLEGDNVSDEALAEYVDPDSERYQKMCEEIRQCSNFTFLRYHRLDDMTASIRLDKYKLCTYRRDDKEDDEEQGEETLSAF